MRKVSPLTSCKGRAQHAGRRAGGNRGWRVRVWVKRHGGRRVRAQARRGGAQSRQMKKRAERPDDTRA